MGFHDQAATYVGAVQLKTDNLERTLVFYRDVLGFKILEQRPDLVRLSTDGKSPILTVIQPANALPKQGRTTGLYHFAILLPKRSDLARFVNHLIKHDVRFGASDHLVSEAIYFDDPDGNGIEVYADTKPSTWEWDEHGVSMDTLRLDFEDLLSSTDLTQPWNGLPEKTIIGHIHLHVSELPRTEIFYTKGLGFEVVARFRDSALFLSTNKYHHHIALNTWNGVGAPRPAKNSAGLDFFTLVYPNEESLKSAVANLESLGAVAEPENGLWRVEDPSGNIIHLTVKTPDDYRDKVKS